MAVVTGSRNAARRCPSSTTRDDAAASATQRGRARIGTGVAELGRRGEHALPRGRGHLRLAAEDDGCGRRGHARLRGRRRRSSLGAGSRDWSYSEDSSPGSARIESIRYAVRMDTALTRSQYVRWRTAIFAIFLASGLSIATWASRVPDIKLALEVDKAQVGMLLLGIGIASIIGISTSPAVMARTGARLGMMVSIFTFASGSPSSASARTSSARTRWCSIGLVLFGFGNGCVDVMMNVEATAIEQQLGQDDPSAVPRLLQLRHGDRGRARRPRRAAADQRVRAHPRRRGADRRRSVSSASRACRRARRRSIRSLRREKPHWRERMHVALVGLARTAHLCDRRGHARDVVRRGRGQRLARARRRRGPRRAARHSARQPSRRSPSR